MIKLNKIIGVVMLLALTGCGRHMRYGVSGDDIAKEVDACKDQTLWAHSVEKKSEYNGVVFERSTPKCNLFVSDMLHRAGITPPTRNDKWRGPITANQWTGSVYGFSKATSQQRGDIVADIVNIVESLVIANMLDAQIHSHIPHQKLKNIYLSLSVSNLY